MPSFGTEFAGSAVHILLIKVINMTVVINNVAPYFTLGNSDIIGFWPIESDIFYHFSNAFADLGFNEILPDWICANKTLSMDETASLKKLETLPSDEKIIIFNSTNFGYSNKIDEIAYKYSNDIKSCFKNSVSVTFLPDPHVNRGQELLSLVHECLEYSDWILSPYPAIVDILNNAGSRNFDSSKIICIDCVPTRFHLDDAKNNKSVDVCYVGSAKHQRMRAIQELISEPLRFYVDTSGRFDSPLNTTRTVKSYMDRLSNSRMTIATFAHAARPVGVYNNLEIHSPGVLPGRVAEAIACGCIPFLIYEYIGAKRHCLPANAEGKFPIWETFYPSIRDDARTFFNNYDEAKMKSVCRDYHQKHLCAGKILGPLLTKII